MADKALLLQDAVQVPLEPTNVPFVLLDVPNEVLYWFGKVSFVTVID